MNKLEFYMNLDYPITLRRIAAEDGGGWLAEIIDLPGCFSDGETPQEALDNIEDAKKNWLEVAIERKQQIPIPKSEDENEFSGKFTLRIPKTLHRQLTKIAKEEGVSLNQYITTLLSYNFGGQIMCCSQKCKDSKQQGNTYITVNYPPFDEQSIGLTKGLWKNSAKRDRKMQRLEVVK